jgi:hypothetical protein
LRSARGEEGGLFCLLLAEALVLLVVDGLLLFLLLLKDGCFLEGDDLGEEKLELRPPNDDDDDDDDDDGLFEAEFCLLGDDNCDEDGDAAADDDATDSSSSRKLFFFAEVNIADMEAADVIDIVLASSFENVFSIMVVATFSDAFLDKRWAVAAANSRFISAFNSALLVDLVLIFFK